MQPIQITGEPMFPKHMFSVINDPVETKTNPGVLIIIPSKDRNDLLFQCINSIIIQTATSLTNITIAIVDTGSNEETLSSIKEYIHRNDSHIALSLLPHGYYNFAKNNNQAFREMYNYKEHDYVLFCNNDILILNDAISHMIKVYEDKSDVGTVGIRLHFEDGRIQHLGAYCKKDKSGNISPGHYGFGVVTTGRIIREVKRVDCNTGAFLMMPAKLFDQCSFNEDYSECFEDIQLNLTIAIKFNKVNYIACAAAAFHFESQTRNEDPQKLDRQKSDLNKLKNFVYSNKNQNYIKKHIFDL